MIELEAGDSVTFREERQCYKVYASDNRYAVCIKPFNVRGTTLYTIVDKVRGERGPDDRVFSEGCETQSDAERILRQIQTGEIGVSYRKRIPVNIVRYIKP